MTSIKEVKGAGHAAAKAMMVKDKCKDAGEGDRSYMQTGEMGHGIRRCQRRKAEAHELFAGKDCAAEGQNKGSNWNYTLKGRINGG